MSWWLHYRGAAECKSILRNLLVLLQPLNKSNGFQNIDNVVDAPSLNLENGSSIVQRNDTAVRPRKMLQELLAQQTK